MTSKCYLFVALVCALLVEAALCQYARQAPNFGHFNLVEELRPYAIDSDQTRSDDLSNMMIPIKEKKASQIGVPLPAHRRKDYLAVPSTALLDTSDVATRREQCEANTIAERNRIIDSKNSVANGADMIDVRIISTSEATDLVTLVDLERSCMKMCCDKDECDSALLSLKVAHDGHRCYLFKCSGRCIYVKHSDYVVLRGRTSEQLLVGGNGNGNDSPLSDGSASSNAHNKDIMTGQKQPNSKCSAKYEFTCRTSGKCIAIYDVCDGIEHCDDKSDEASCEKSDKGLGSPASSLAPSILRAPMKPLVPTTSTASKSNYLVSKNDNTDDDLGDDSSDALRLIEQQEQIVRHLNELESARSSNGRFRDRENARLGLNKEEEEEVPKRPRPIDVIDSFMKINGGRGIEVVTAPFAHYRSTRTSPSPRSTTSYQRSAVLFHDEHDNSKDQADASSFVSKALTLRSSSVKTDRLLIMLLIISSVAVVISFTLCLVCCTKCCRRRINRFRKDKYDADRYLDVEGDYLINGMYI